MISQQQHSRETHIAIDKLRKLGITNVVVVDDTKENIQAATYIQHPIEKAGLKFVTFNGVDEARKGIGNLNPSGHALVLADFFMPSQRVFLNRKNAGGIEVIDICLENEKQGHLLWPVIVSHTGIGHTGEMVDVCYGNGNFVLDNFKSGKADPKFWELTIQILAQALTEGKAEPFWRTRMLINKSDPYRPSALQDDSFKLGYISLAMINNIETSAS